MAKKLDYHAKLVIHGLPEMKRSTQRRLVVWLLATAREMKREPGKVFAKTYTARLMK